MTRILNAQRRLFLVVTAVVITTFIRLISLSLGNHMREGRHAVVVSDRGRFKQVALRFARFDPSAAHILPIRLGVHTDSPNTAYLLRIANFAPFIRLEQLGVVAELTGLSSLATPDGILGQSCDGDGDGDGGGDGDGDGCCDGDGTGC